MSHLSRSSRLFSTGPWLPLRDHVESADIHECEAEDISFSTRDGLALKGSYFPQRSRQRRGIILYAHEMNGNRWSVVPFLDKLRNSGFDVFTFDQRGQGESEIFEKFHTTPWITAYDIQDIESALDYVELRNSGLPLKNREGAKIGIFGLGKGATLALCCAGLDDRIQCVVMDSPAPEDRLYERNCLTSLARSGSVLATRRFSMFLTLLVKSAVRVVACPFLALYFTWRRFMLSLWCGGSFVNIWPIIRKMRKPIMILHGGLESCVSLEQIHSFSHRMSVRPKIWLSGKTDSDSSQEEKIAEQVAVFFQESVEKKNENQSPKTSRKASRFKRPFGFPLFRRNRSAITVRETTGA